MKKLLLSLLVLGSISAIASEKEAIFDSCICSAFSERESDINIVKSNLKGASYQNIDGKIQVNSYLLAEFALHDGFFSTVTDLCNDEREKLIKAGVCPRLD